VGHCDFLGAHLSSERPVIGRLILGDHPVPSRT
jgi:hypothetical protein